MPGREGNDVGKGLEDEEKMGVVKGKGNEEWKVKAEAEKVVMTAWTFQAFDGPAFYGRYSSLLEGAEWTGAYIIPQFVSMIQQSAYAQLTISLHYTKAVVGNMRVNNGVHPDLSMHAGRPRLISAMEAIISRAMNAGGDQCGLIVGVCGPVGLGDDVSRAVGLVDPMKRDQIGGIEIHEEVFGW
ncbi:hypothetical protein C8R43DRAFT_1116328 [Mycena crocata]|nr:hypothetical protein C8R43DRAFT_1116328 [Mycena crocata]